MKTIVSRRFVRDRRRGAATIEMALGLPLLCAMIGLILTVAAACLATLEAQVLARSDAWDGRFERAATARLDVASRNSGVLLGPRPRIPATAGLRSGQADVPVLDVFPLVTSKLPVAQRRSYLYAGVWDHREIAFATQRRHPALTFDEKVLCFTGSSFPTTAFRRLASIQPVRSASE